MPNLSAVVEYFEQRLLERTMRFDDVGIGINKKGLCDPKLLASYTWCVTPSVRCNEFSPEGYVIYGINFKYRKFLLFLVRAVASLS